MRLVPSKTTLLGLVKHVTYVEGVWFDQSVTGRSSRQVGIPTTPARSFTLTSNDTIASIQATHRQHCAADGPWRHSPSMMPWTAGATAWSGPCTLQVLHELAQHAGHADILREQIIARRAV